MAPFNYRLVQEVKKYSLLWDRQSKLHRQAGHRGAAWSRIAATLDVSVDDCQTRWRTIRDTYLKRKRRPSFTVKGQWRELEPELVFLDEFLQPNIGCVLLKKPEPGDKRGPSVPYPAALPSSAAEQPAFGADRHLSLLPDAPPPMPRQLPSSHSPSVVEKCPSNGDRLFCLSLVGRLKRMPPSLRNVARIKVLQVLSEFQDGSYGDPEATADVMAVANSDA
ncbi:uncharacterized protein LOC144158797 [Haemaphysalis longicornis]